MANPCEVLLQLLLLSQSLWLPVKPDVLPTGLKGGVPSGHNSHPRPAFSKSHVRIQLYSNSWVCLELFNMGHSFVSNINWCV